MSNRRRVKFADPVIYPDLHHRQVLEMVQRASIGRNVRIITLCLDEAEAPSVYTAEGLSTTTDLDSGDGRSSKSA